MRDIRTMNMTEGQKIDSEVVIKRIGDLAYRNLGTLTKSSLFDEGKALVTSGLRVAPDTGMTVKIPSGVCFQRSVDVVIPVVQVDGQTVTMDAASGVVRVDMVEAQIKSIPDKNDTDAIATVSSGSTAGSVVIDHEEIKRDIKYYLAVRKKTNTTTPTAATAGKLTGTVSIPVTIDLSEKYFIHLADGEDGSFQDIDCRGAVPEATTRGEVIANINAAVGRTIASTGDSNNIVLTGEGTGITSQFTIKPPVTDADRDALEAIFGISTGGAYRYRYVGDNEWFKLAEIDIGAASMSITSTMIRNIGRKSTWASGATDILIRDHVYQADVPAWNEWSSGITYSEDDVAWVAGDQYVSLKDENTGNDPLTKPGWWLIAPSFEETMRDFQSAQLQWGSIAPVHDIRNTNYRSQYLAGYYRRNNRIFKTYHVHLDGAAITGSSLLESLFDIGGDNEYFALDAVSKNALGTYNLTDTRGYSFRTIDSVGGDTENIGVLQEDALQNITGSLGSSGSPLMAGANIDGTEGSGALSLTQQTGDYGRGAGEPGTYGRPIESISFDASDSPDARTADETRMKNLTVGVPYIVMVVEI